MRKTKTQKGITLIALIITIVVLLILAVVAIRAVQGDGIISKAKEAQTKYEDAQANEKLELGMQSYRLAHNGEFDLNDFVSNVGTYVDRATGKGAVVTVDGYKINVEGKIANWSTEPTSGTWYVSDDTLIWDGDIVIGFRRDLDWCADIMGSDTTGMPTYAIYMSKLYENGSYIVNRIVFSENVKKIGNAATYDDFYSVYSYFCNHIPNIEFLSGTVELPEGFASNSSVDEYTVPTYFKVLPANSFSNFYNLENLTIPSTVTSIADTAFRNVGSNTTSITINVVRGSAGDTWAQARQASNSKIVINYITE